MYRAYKFRIYPTDKQKELLNKSFGCSRFIYNYYLDRIKNNKYISAMENIKDYINNLKYEYIFLQEVDSILIRKTLFHLDDNLKKYYNNNFGYPKYKSKFDKNSYTTSAVYGTYYGHKYCNIKIDLENKKIKLPKLKWVNIRGYRNKKKIEGKIINATISIDTNKKYYVSVIVETLSPIKVEAKSIVGIDIGIKKLITMSDTTTYENNKYIKKYEKRIKKIQKDLSRKQKRSNNYKKCKEKLGVLYTKLKNARKYYIHKITKEITDTYDIIVTEKLNTKKMIMQKELSKEISDATFSEIIKILEYKSKYKGKIFIQIDSYYPSSQKCSICGNIDRKYKNLNEREYKCTKCRNNLDRDINASINIMYEGLKMYMKTLEV